MKCKLCGSPSQRKYCNACKDRHLGVVVTHRELPDRDGQAGWVPVSEGGFVALKHVETEASAVEA